MDTLRYDYKPKLWASLLGGLFFAGCGVVLGKVALDNDRGLILNGLIELDTGDATTFYGVLAAACIGFVAIALVSTVRAFGAPHEVVLDATSITAPKGVMQKVVVTVPYTRITDLQVTQVQSQKLLTIHHADGKLVIARGMLPTRADFEELLAALDARCRAVRGR